MSVKMMVKTNVKRFLLMFQFLTTIPLPLNLDAEDKDLGEGLIYAVPVGLVIGLILAAFNYLFALIFAPLICAVLLNVVYIITTGGLHLDGFADTIDGIFSYRTRERMLEIMKDSRLGSNAVIALICILLLNTALYYETTNIKTSMLILMPVIGRMGIIIGAGISQYARSNGGMGKAFTEYCGSKQIIISLIMCGTIFLAFGNYLSIAAGAISCVFSICAAKYISKKLGGITGDVLGALCEATQTFFMMVMYILSVVI